MEQAVGQICSTASMSHNLKLCQSVIGKAVAAGAKAVFLPEASDYIASSAEESVSLCKSVQDSEFVRGIQAEARHASLPINVGIHEPAADGRIKNTLLWIDEQGDITQRYQKLHLFDVEIENGPVLKESKSVEPGHVILSPFETGIGRVGLAICYDVRFPEVSLNLRRQGAQIITYPSAFTIPTGKAHWRPLLQARAIESQAWVIAAAQVGRHNEKRASYGHSIIVSPWGEIKAELGDTDNGPEIATADIDLPSLERIRVEMPLWQQRRTMLARRFPTPSPDRASLRRHKAMISRQTPRTELIHLLYQLKIVIGSVADSTSAETKTLSLIRLSQIETELLCRVPQTYTDSDFASHHPDEDLLQESLRRTGLVLLSAAVHASQQTPGSNSNLDHTVMSLFMLDFEALLSLSPALVVFILCAGGPFTTGALRTNVLGWLATAASKVGIQIWPAAHSYLSSAFFYYPSIQDSGTRALWEECQRLIQNPVCPALRSQSEPEILEMNTTFAGLLEHFDEV
ncbi:hypothetical protein FH972_021937 [Carpinus fangiana]|uniref:CN hydrolase domain-containing protein n=1 Tax=Carpinus fangiana TaxID=176857 RepID=A0A5N6KR51_9ROSI|nr:hypothetical protein FH972_021937 [Carpinus fangiana]